MDSDYLLHRLEDPAHAVAPYPTFYEGPRPLAVDLDHSNPPDDGDVLGQPKRERMRYDNDCTLWVGNVDLRISETMLFELFSQVGDIRNVTFPNQQNQQDDERVSRFCFINFLSPDSVPKAIQTVQGTVLFGRKLFLKCRPGSIHALQQPYQHQQKHKTAGSSSSLQKAGPSGNSQRSWVSSSGADSTSDLKKFSPIRAPSPEGLNGRAIDFDAPHSNASSRGHRKVVLLEDKYVTVAGRGENSCSYDSANDYYRPETNSTGARRRVVIKPSSGSVIPVININTPQKKIKSVVVAPQSKKTTTPTKSEINALTEASSSSSSTTIPSNTPTHPTSPIMETTIKEIKKPQSIPSLTTSANHPNPPPPPRAIPIEKNAGETFSSNRSIEVLQPQQHQFNPNMSRQWRPQMQFYGYQNQDYQQQQQPRYNYNNPGMRPVYPHYNKYFRFNGSATGRHPHPPLHAAPRFRSYPPHPPVRQYGNGYEQYATFGQPQYGYSAPPFRPRFDSYDSYHHPPQYPGQYNYHDQSNAPLGGMNSEYNYSAHNNHHHLQQQHTYYNTEHETQESIRSCIPPAPPRIRSRSRTRSRSKSPRLRTYYRGETPMDKFRRMKSRSRSKSPSIESHYKRRSASRGSSSSYSRGYRSSSQRRFDPQHRERDRDRGHKRSRRSRSQSYSSGEETKTLRHFRPVRPSSAATTAKGGLTRRSTTSPDTSESDQDKRSKNKSPGELSFSDDDHVGNKNDNTAVSSTNNGVKRKSKKSQKVDGNTGTSNSNHSHTTNSQQASKQGKGRKSRFIRTSVSSYRAEGEYDPSDPGY